MLQVPSPTPELSWVLPLFRTADALRELVSRIDAVSGELGVASEIILVDDACPAGSGAIAEEIADSNPRVAVLRLPMNRGQDDALREGFRVCRGEWALILDADLQDPPEALRQLWPARGAAMDCVFVHRTGSYTTPGRHFTSRIYRKLIERVGGLPPGACLFALLRRPLIDCINRATGERISLLALIAACGNRFASVPFERARRLRGASAYGSFARSAKAARSLWQIFLARQQWRFARPK